MRLKITESDQVYFVKISKPNLTFGRSRAADVRLNCVHTSGLHCSLQLDPDTGLFIEDLKSMNGTFVDEKLITSKTRIFLINKIRIGEVTIVIDGAKLSAREHELLAPTLVE